MDVIDLEDCFLDGPQYREKLIRCDNHLQALEHCLKDVLKSARAVIDQTHNLSVAQDVFLESLATLGRLEANRPTRESDMKPFFGVSSLETWSAVFMAEELKRIEVARQSLILQLETVFIDPLESLARTDLPSLREGRKKWERTGDRYGEENSRFLARKPTRDPSGDTALVEAATEMALVRRSFHEASLEYVGRLNEIMNKEELRIAEAVTTLIHCRMAFGERERDVFEDVKANLKCLDSLMDVQRRKKTFQSKENIKKISTLQEAYDPLYNPLSLAVSPPLPSSSVSPRHQVGELMGYLYKKSSHSMRPVWSRRFFHLRPSGNVLVYYTQEGKKNSNLVSIDLRLCTVKVSTEPPPERRNVFEIVTPQKTYTVQAETDREFVQWTEGLQASIERAINEGSQSTGSGAINLRSVSRDGENNTNRDNIGDGNGHNSTNNPATLMDFTLANTDILDKYSNDGNNKEREKSKMARRNLYAPRSATSTIGGREHRLSNAEALASYLPGHVVEAPLDAAARQAISSVPGNDRCADCGRLTPEWASLSLGILICIQCSGIHRSLGVHISKVRSLRLDYWEPEHVEIMKGLGNEMVNKLFEANLLFDRNEAFYPHPTPESSQEEKEQWIVAKYVLQKFIQSNSPLKSEDVVLAIRTGDLIKVLKWVVTQKEEINQALNPTSNLMALHLAIESQQWSVATLLLLWSADPGIRDAQGRTILHIMAGLDNFSLSFLISLLRRGCVMTQSKTSPAKTTSLSESWLEARDTEGMDPIARATASGQGDFVTILRMFQHDQQQEKQKKKHRRGPSQVTNEPFINQHDGNTIKEETSSSDEKSQIDSPSSSSSSTHSTSNNKDENNLNSINNYGKKKKKSLKKLFRQYPRFYRRFTRHHSTSASSGDNNNNNGRKVKRMIEVGEETTSPGIANMLADSVAHLNPFHHHHHRHHQRRWNHERSQSDQIAIPSSQSTIRGEEFSSENIDYNKYAQICSPKEGNEDGPHSD